MTNEKDKQDLPTPEAGALYREGLDRIFRLLDLKLERQPNDIATLQRVAHDYLVQGNALNSNVAQDLIQQARSIAVAVSGDSDSAAEIQTSTQAWQVINGFIRKQLSDAN